MIRGPILNLAASFRLSIISKSQIAVHRARSMTARIWKLSLVMHLESWNYTVRGSLHLHSGRGKKAIFQSDYSATHSMVTLLYQTLHLTL